MVSTSCETSYNVLSHSNAMNWGLNRIVLMGVGGGAGSSRVVDDVRGGNAKETVSILDFQKLVSL